MRRVCPQEKDKQMFTRRQTLALAAAAAAVPVLPGPGRATPPAADPLQPVEVRVKRDLVPGQIIVLTASHQLYHILGQGRAIRYPVGVGREGLNFRGEAVIARKAEWPSWRPTPDMIARNPRYARWAGGMPGGPENPLGARALYLYQNGHDTAFRIHGTTEPQSIGQSVSNGCIRMLNSHVAHLYDAVPVGTPVTVY
jgi:lipoprotein-anchoring transpeptidase ErfK/SrfK